MQQNLFTRHDTILGVCEGLSQDFRINANLIRVALALGLFFNPVAAVGTYFGLGLLVLLTRLLVPAAATGVASLPEPIRLPTAGNDAHAQERLAA